MKLEEVFGSYDLIIGLGSACNPTLQIRKYGLRRYSFPLDWVVTSYIDDVTKVIRNKFQDYMLLHNMQRIDGRMDYLEEEELLFVNQDTPKAMHAYLIQDRLYRILSVHDFPENQEGNWKSYYPVYKAKLNERVTRFYDKIANSSSVLFLRWGYASQASLVALHRTLSALTAGKVVLICLQPVEGVSNNIEVDNQLEGICEINVPLDAPNAPEVWDPIMTKLSVTGYWK